MLQVIVLVAFFMTAIGIFAAALMFSKYKKREDGNGCCGGGHCAADGTPHSCYSSKTDFVDNFEKIKAERLEVKS